MTIVEIVMPKMGESIAEATIINWLKEEGDYIEEDEILLEVATDKVDSEVPSSVSGRLISILHPVDSVVAVGAVLARIETEEQLAAAPSITSSEIVDTPTIDHSRTLPTIVDREKDIPLDQTHDMHQYYSPAVRHLALSGGLVRAELATIVGSGPSGRLTPDDVRAYLAEIRQAKHTDDSDKPSSAVQATTLSTFVEIDVTSLRLWIDSHDGLFEQKYGHSLTLPLVLIDIISKALDGHPEINSNQSEVNIALSPSSDDTGLQVLHGCESLNLAGMASQMAQLSSEKERATFIIRNTEHHKTTNITSPRIIDGCSAVLALGRIAKRPIIQESDEGDVIAIRHMMYVSLSFDHQQVDGATADAFLSRILQDIETFDTEKTF